MYGGPLFKTTRYSKANPAIINQAKQDILYDQFLNAKYFLPGIQEYSNQSNSKKDADDEENLVLSARTASFADKSSVQGP